MIATNSQNNLDTTKTSAEESSYKRVKMTDWYGEGKEDGILEERIRKSAEDIVGVIDKFGCSLEDALEAVKVSDEDREEVLGLVRELQALSR